MRKAIGYLLLSVGVLAVVWGLYGLCMFLWALQSTRMMQYWLAFRDGSVPVAAEFIGVALVGLGAASAGGRIIRRKKLNFIARPPSHFD